MAITTELTDVTFDTVVENAAIVEAIFAETSKIHYSRALSTYRIQLNHAFRLNDLTSQISYLHALGITDVYLSPFLTAKPGSTHGYDIQDPTRINPEIGDEATHRALLEELAQFNMQRLLDIVPNHMGISGGNQYWLDVLEFGRCSQYATMFDFDWEHRDAALVNKIVLPILDASLEKLLKLGRVKLYYQDGSFVLLADQTRLPLDPRSLAIILKAADLTVFASDASDVDRAELLSLSQLVTSLVTINDGEASRAARLRTESLSLKRRLSRLTIMNPRIARLINQILKRFNRTAIDRQTFELWHELIEIQAYRLVSYHDSTNEINYRRFFDINDLAGVRVEDPLVFDLIHAKILTWVGQEGIAGLRVDHPDGLADPQGYFARLQESIFLIDAERVFHSTNFNAEWDALRVPLREKFRMVVASEPLSKLARRFPLVVEKILTGPEPLPQTWPVDGTVGYETLNALNGLFVDPAGRAQIAATYQNFTADRLTAADVLYLSKVQILNVSLASEVSVLTRMLERIVEASHAESFVEVDKVRATISEVLACFPVYRTYLRAGDSISDVDRSVIEAALNEVRLRKPDLNDKPLTFLRQVLLRENDRDSAELAALSDTFITRFQQTTGPVQAKGLEDTTFYRQIKLASLNEVGADPNQFGNSPGEFHRLNHERVKIWPSGLTTTATHDTKRGEDARIRINVLAELASDWDSNLKCWARTNQFAKITSNGREVPDAVEDILFYQTLIGVWPFDEPEKPSMETVERVRAYMVKAVREAKRNTSWSDTTSDYVEQLSEALIGILTGPTAERFFHDFQPFQRRIARIGVVHSLSQAVLKIGSPGIADFYQGTELWDLHLVDPDNRQPVDYCLRSGMLTDIHRRLACGSTRAELASGLMENFEDGAIKLYLLATALEHRRAHHRLFSEGDYLPIEAVGHQASKIVAFARSMEDDKALIVAPRLVTDLMGPEGKQLPIGSKVWGTTAICLPESCQATRWRDILTDHVVDGSHQGSRIVLQVSEIFRNLPVAILVPVDD